MSKPPSRAMILLMKLRESKEAARNRAQLEEGEGDRHRDSFGEEQEELHPVAKRVEAADRDDGDGGPREPAGSGQKVLPHDEEPNDAQVLPPARGGLLTLLKNIKAQRMMRTSSGDAAEVAEHQSRPKTRPEVDIDEVVDNVGASLRLDENKVENSELELERKIIRQVEHYFGDYNLPRDRFLLEKMEEDFGWIPMTTMMTFKRLSQLTKDSKVVLRALSRSSSGLLEVDFESERIRRDPRLPFPEMNDARRVSLQERTVFVAGFNRQGTTLDDLIDYFENNFQKVCNVRMRTLRPLEGTSGQTDQGEIRFLGSAFVTFSSRQAAVDFLRQKLQHKGKKLISKWQKDFFSEKTEYNDEFNANTIGRTVFVHGFDKMETSQEELADFFGRFPGAVSVRRRVFRDRRETYDEENQIEWKFTGSIFVTFDSCERAQRFLQMRDLNYEGDKLKQMWQKDFFAEKGKFRRELMKLEQQSANEE